MESLFGLYNEANYFTDEDIGRALESISLSNKRTCHKKDFGDWLLACANGNISFENKELISGLYNEKYNYSRAYLSKDNKSLTLETDYLGLRPLYYLKLGNSFSFSSEIEPLLELIKIKKQPSIDGKEIAYYLTWGISSPENTFFEEIKLLPENSILTFCNGEIYLKRKSNPFIDVQRPKLSDIKEALHDSLQAWISKYDIKAANLSGGADTRILMALLTKEQRKEFQFYVDASPFLEEDNDKDVIGAKLLAKTFGLNLKVQKCEPVTLERDNLYDRSAPAQIPKISGNHGGEILGYDVFTTLGFIFDQKTPKVPDGLVIPLEKETFTPELSIPNDFQSRYLWSVQTLFRPFFTDIYDGGSFNHWTIPHRFSQKKFAPFWSNLLIYQLSLLDKDEAINYKIYKNLYLECFEEFSKIPFFSPLVTHHSTHFKMIDNGINQKDTFKRVSSLEAFNNFKEDMRRYHLFDEEKLAHTFEEQPIIAKRALKFFMWLRKTTPFLER